MRQWQFVVGVVSVMSMVGCGAAPADEQSEVVGEAPAALATIELESGQKVEFLDLGTTVAVSESANIGTPSILEERALLGHSVEEIFSVLQPGQPMPAALADALARIASQEPAVAEGSDQQVGAAAPYRVATEYGDEGGEKLGKAQQAYTHAQFLAGGGCTFSQPNQQFSHCIRWTGNGYWASYYAKYGYFTTAWGAGGSVTRKVTLNGSTWSSQVPSGAWLNWYTTWTGSGTVLHGIEVTNASNDTFSNGSVFWN